MNSIESCKGTRIMILKPNGQVIADYTIGQLQNQEDVNFSGLLSILEPISEGGKPFLFTIRLGPFQVDVTYSSDIYLFSIELATSNSETSNLNAIFSQILHQKLLQFMNQMDAQSDIHSLIEKQFLNQIPNNYFERISSIIPKLLSDGVSYISIVAQNHRVIYSIGQNPLPADEFILTWCAALQSCNDFQDDLPFLQVADHDNVVIVPFYECLKAIVFFNNISGPISNLIDLYINNFEHFKEEFEKSLHQSIKIQMPKEPPPSRRPGLNRI